MKRHYLLDDSEYVSLNGWRQNLRYRSNCPEGPVILFVHGGPGVCDRHWVLKNQSALAERAVMVCWDQRGAGKSYDALRAKTDTFTIADMVEDMRCAVEYLCAKFRKKKIFIVGHSWGSVLGALYAGKYPERVQAYIGMGQVADGRKNEAMSYAFTWEEAQKRHDEKAIADLTRIGAPVDGKYKSLDDLTTQRNYMTKYGGGCYREKESIWRSMVLPLLHTPEYSLADLPGYARGAFYCLDQLWAEVCHVDFLRDVPAIAAPVYITQGRHDQNTPPVLARAWFDALTAPKKEWFWFEESAHSPIKEEPALWGKTVEKILADNP